MTPEVLSQAFGITEGDPDVFAWHTELDQHIADIRIRVIEADRYAGFQSGQAANFLTRITGLRCPMKNGIVTYTNITSVHPIGNKVGNEFRLLFPSNNPPATRGDFFQGLRTSVDCRSRVAALRLLTWAGGATGRAEP